MTNIAFYQKLAALGIILCSVELSPDLTPSFQLYISFQICSKDASFPVPVALSF